MKPVENYPSALSPLPNLSALSIQPVYNIKAIDKRTGIPAATLRAWERRYSLPQPDRSEQGYRLYSERDVALLMWLRQQVENGLSIAHAVRQLRYLIKTTPPDDRVKSMAALKQPMFIHSIRSPAVLRRELSTAIQQNDMALTDQLITEALALFTLETTLLLILHDAVRDVVADHQSGTRLSMSESVALSHIQQRLLSLMQTVPIPSNSRPALVTVGFGAEHTAIERTIIELLLRRKGITVLPLGADLDPILLENGVVPPTAQLIVFYTDDPANAARLINLSLPIPAVWCGHAGNLAPQLTASIPFEYLGADLRDIVQNIIIQVTDYADSAKVTHGPL